MSSNHTARRDRLRQIARVLDAAVRDDGDAVLACDFISLHAALTNDNARMISQERLALMKKTAILINTARGELVDEDALLKALQEKKLYGAGLDVFTIQPPNNPAWYALDSVVIGSHTASSTIGATTMMGEMAVSNLLRDLNKA